MREQRISSDVPSQHLRRTALTPAELAYIERFGGLTVEVSNRLGITVNARVGMLDNGRISIELTPAS